MLPQFMNSQQCFHSLCFHSNVPTIYAFTIMLWDCSSSVDGMLSALWKSVLITPSLWIKGWCESNEEY